VQHLDRAAHVDIGVQRRVVHRHSHVGLRRQVEDGLRLHAAHQRLQRGAIPDIELDQLGLRRHPVALAGAERVDHPYTVAPGDERVGDVRSDEPRSPGDDGMHGAGG
jgi:hypothetical protein